MTKFSHVIIRRPGKSLSNGITSAPELGQPIYERAIEEHYDYEHALEQCGVDVSVLPALEQYPDSCFVEDPAVITRCGAIITTPGADSRNGEKDEIEPAVRRFFDDEHVKHIVSPGTLDGGDVMMVGDHFYVGRSARTNEEGIRQFCEILEGWGLEGSEVPLEEVLHLKTGVNYIEDNNMLVSGEFPTLPSTTRSSCPRTRRTAPTASGSTVRSSLPRAIRPCSRPCRIWATRRSSSIPPSIARSTVAFLACHCASNAMAVTV